MPTRDTPWPAGTPCWVDYGAADLDAAKAFYADLLGWEYTGGEPEFGGYLNAVKDGRQVAGLGPQMDANDPPRWTTYFATDDAEATATRIREAGGTVLVEPMEVGPMGTMVVALDPQGNPFGLWQAGTHTGVQRYNEPGSLVWNDAAVDDPAAAREFYAAVFGFRYDEVDGAEGYTTFSTGDRPLGGLGGHQPGSPKGWAACFAVASTDEAVATVESAGGKVTMAPMDTEYGRFAVVEDPWGAPFSVMQVAQE
ncbi:VOC family protein [Blastococcus deserti]|uniref:VOC family protein n=1 Tax=Blastococcus deserti TaxID=2259033 RepID=A0ABW4XAV6_9ACTN